MKLTRPALCLALVASVTAATAATAATRPRPKPLKPVCNVVVDPAGDASPQPPAPSDDSFDVLSADIASDAKNVTAVIRMKNVSSTGLGQLGRDVQMTFDLVGAEAKVWIGYTGSSYGGDAFQYGLIGMGDAGSTSPTGDAVGKIDAAKNEIRMTVPVADLNGLGKIKPGAKVSSIAVTASQLVGVAPNPSGVYAFNSFTVDDAAAVKPYIAGYPSCVKPG
ncbi:MAG TPA: hypothetical protein VM097_06490 [Mycobacteriales bacterium]|nr:hypothetical protein [Mycobacteriales bacterium]